MIALSSVDSNFSNMIHIQCGQINFYRNDKSTLLFNSGLVIGY